MYAFVDIEDTRLISVKDNFMVHSMIANGDIILNNKGLYLDISDYTIRDHIIFQQMKMIYGDHVVLDKNWCDVSSDDDSMENPLFYALSESLVYCDKFGIRCDNINSILSYIKAESDNVIPDVNSILYMQQKNKLLDYCKMFNSYMILDHSSIKMEGTLEAATWFFGTMLYNFPIGKLGCSNTIQRVMKAILFKINAGIYSTNTLPGFSEYTGSTDEYFVVLTNYYNQKIKNEPYMFCSLLERAAIFISNNNIIDGQTFSDYLDKILNAFLPSTDMRTLNNINEMIFPSAALLVRSNILDKNDNFIKNIDGFNVYL